MVIGDAYQSMFECTKCRRRIVRRNFHLEVVCDCGNGMSPVTHVPFKTLAVWDEWVELPLFEMVTNPTVRLSDIKHRRFRIRPDGCLDVHDEIRESA